ncbi:MAG: isochorismatase family protein [Betaproteobacteria bacterium]
MHKVSIRKHIVERVVARRGDIHWFERLEAARTALLVIDMQDTFCLPGAPGEVPLSRDIVPTINHLAGRLRPMGVPVIWVIHAKPTCAATRPRATR